jgi:hypothetical protein
MSVEEQPTGLQATPCPHCGLLTFLAVEMPAVLHPPLTLRYEQDALAITLVWERTHAAYRATPVHTYRLHGCAPDVPELRHG